MEITKNALSQVYVTNDSSIINSMNVDKQVKAQYSLKNGQKIPISKVFLLAIYRLNDKISCC